MKLDFWDGLWSGEKSLKDAFPRLFIHSTKKGGKVGEMGSWTNNRWMWDLGWRRGLRERELEWETTLLNLLQNF